MRRAYLPCTFAHSVRAKSGAKSRMVLARCKAASTLHLVGIVFWDHELDERARVKNVAHHRARSSRSNSRDKFSGFPHRCNNRSLSRAAAANTGSSTIGVSSTSTRCPSGNPGDSSRSTTFPRIVPQAFIASPWLRSLPSFSALSRRKASVFIPSLRPVVRETRGFFPLIPACGPRSQ